MWYIANYDRDRVGMDSSSLNWAGLYDQGLGVGCFLILGQGGQTTTSMVKCQVLINQWWWGKGEKLVRLCQSEVLAILVWRERLLPEYLITVFPPFLAFLRWKAWGFNSSYQASRTGETKIDTFWPGSRFLTCLKIVLTDCMFENSTYILLR